MWIATLKLAAGGRIIGAAFGSDGSASDQDSFFMGREEQQAQMQAVDLCGLTQQCAEGAVQSQFVEVYEVCLVQPSLVSTSDSPLVRWLSLWKPLRRTISDWDKFRRASWSKLRIDTEARIDALNLKAESRSISLAELSELKSQKEALDKCYKDTCIYWSQRAKKRWLKDVDRNSRFSHLCASRCRKINWISSIQDDGSLISDREGITSAFREYYVSLLGKETTSHLQVNWNCIFEPHRLNLLGLDGPFSMTEVSEVIKAAKGFKSPGPDVVMEAALKLRLFAVAVIVVVMASSLVQKAAATDAPAPSPTSAAPASSTAAAAMASVAALAFGYFFC
ncbi:hypothetical protein Cni_G24001 [Canna indica]|uniref:Uncharacterized protein n=1 Tax=Canna indica TaxID=4628 RepID=A0AAQ3KV62_9LILI|nr:hypothetical protein Cni_G24001 [Canna indica]